MSLFLISLSSLIRRKPLCQVKAFLVLPVAASFPFLLSFQFPTAKSTDLPHEIQHSSNFCLPKQYCTHSSDDRVPTPELSSRKCAQFADMSFYLGLSAKFQASTCKVHQPNSMREALPFSGLCTAAAQLTMKRPPRYLFPQVPSTTGIRFPIAG